MRVTRTALSIAILLTATAAFAQNRKPLSGDEERQYVVSAKAGVVNVVEGEASVTRARPFAMPDVLISGDELNMGDTVKTGASARAEVLLNPGCYLRLGGNSEFVLFFDNFTSHKIKLLRGVAVIEASAIDGLIFVETPKTKFEIVRAGLYRFNVSTDGKSEVAVRKGRVLAGYTWIKEGKRAVVEGGTAVVAKLNKNDADDLDDWSKERAKTLIAANKRLSGRAMRRTLGMSFVYNTWIYDPFCRCYTFLPYTLGFTSPYGWGYSVCNPYWFMIPLPRYGNGGWSGGSGGGSSSGGGSGGGGSSGGGGGGGHPAPTPTQPGGGSVIGPRDGGDRERPAPGGPSPSPRRP